DEAAPVAEAEALQHELERAERALPAPSALEQLCAAFSLSPFERDVLLLCAGVELDAAFAELCARAQTGARCTYPTVSLALALRPRRRRQTRCGRRCRRRARFQSPRLAHRRPAAVGRRT